MDKLKEYYTKFIPYLTIEKELDISESPEYLAIKNENAILRAETERHVISRQEFQELRNMIGSLRTTPIPALDPSATSEEKALYEKMLEKEKEINTRKTFLKEFFRCE
ncbi:hypothetical protein RG963_03400 [Methanosarcina sp. Z-7115]|uniref:Uncharacterized protein n=1 Tax=Methanosarcina baikalica TaxID=3073890 RepID=A0ABU2CYM4_9EURY|nr:hypothetical protein [Methanosarcina sp. Z-7115]MDR7664846.1 hypothetical protein [Methanosarcina sp. Z-7115]